MAKPINSYVIGAHDSRPWGEWSVTDVGPGFAVKRIVVQPGARLSLQRHQGRSEVWVVVAGVARVTRDADVFDLAPGQSTAIPLGAVHRLENTGSSDLMLIEVQRGDWLAEDDIERLSDDYGRH